MENAGTIKTSAPNSESIAPSSNPSPVRWRKRFTWGSLVVTVIAAAAVLPPLINFGRYQRQVTSLVSRSLGRPVQLSSVELRLLPRPGFILNNLSVAEDPAFGTEPVLTARSVVATIGILSLWKGKLTIDQVSVDEASLNLVQSPEGRWNIESLMMGAQPTLTQDSSGRSSSAPGKSAGFPYLEATNSRVHLKHGFDKSPYSIMETDLSLWQPDPGQWRVRLRGQPVRTDIEMSWADTGEVRLEATLRAAPQLREMPINLQIEWRHAHLGQLSTLILGSDAGWRGDLTADIDVQGTAESAHTKARIQATGVRREEFTPETPLDFDANCSFEYRHSVNSIHALSCDTALGSGQLHLKAELPGSGGSVSSGSVSSGSESSGSGVGLNPVPASPTAMLEVDQVPLQAALDLLHTVRAGFAPGLSAKGIANGSLFYKPVTLSGPVGSGQTNHAAKLKAATGKAPIASDEFLNSLQGAITVSGATLEGEELKEALVLPTMSWVPTFPTVGLETKFTVSFAPSTSAGNVPAPKPAAKTDPKPASKPVQPTANTAPMKSESQVANPNNTSADAVLTPIGKPASQELTVSLAVAQSGFNVAVKGSLATAQLRSLAYAFGLPHSEGLDGFSGGTSDIDLGVKGPWLDPYRDTYQQTSSDSSDALDKPAKDKSTEIRSMASKSGASKSVATKPAIGKPEASNADFAPQTIQATGTIQIHKAQWKPSYLENPADLQQAVVTVDGNRLAFNSEFSYGSAPASIKGTAIVQGSLSCEGLDCEPQTQIHFGAIDSATIQAALIGNPTQKSILSPILDRVRDRLSSGDKAAWPPMTITFDADSLALGQTTLHKPVAQVRVNKNGDLQIESWQAGILGGEASGTGSCEWPSGAAKNDQPEYEFEGSFTGINPVAAGALADAHWSESGLKHASKAGSDSGSYSGISGTGHLKLSGLDWKALTASANGEIQFTWASGTVQTGSLSPSHSENLRFENWTGTLAIHDGKAELGKNTMVSDKRTISLAGEIPLGGPAKFTLAPPTQQLAKDASSTTATDR